MNPEDEKLLDENTLYAPDSFRGEEVQAREEAFKKGNDGFEKAELARQALLEQEKKAGKLTKAGNYELGILSPVNHPQGDESYTEYPFVEDNGEVSHRRR